MVIKNRHEMVFIYDAKFANPNGDPLENNELRMIGDELYVTDVRLKRTIRDYWDSLGNDVFVKEELKEDGNVKSIKDRLKEEKIDDKKTTNENVWKFLEKFIDVRSFGSAILTKLTWPVQFNFGESMHDIEQVRVQWTSVFSSWEERWQGTFTEMFMVPYSIISFHGIVNENAAKTTWMDEDDLSSLKDWIWNWTKNLLTRSKLEQLPRILIDVEFKEWVNTHIWELDKFIDFIPNDKIRDTKAISDISDWKFDFTKLIERLKDYKNKIEKVEIKIDKRVIVENLEDNEINLRIDKI